jgi:glycosyltransferase involved in cell wall biosynthesis
MKRDIGINPHKVRLIYNGVDTVRFTTDVNVRTAERKAMGLSPDQVVIGIVARLATIKNHKALLQAYALLSQDPRNCVSLVIAGDGPERHALEELAHELGIANNVSFLGERHDVPELLNVFDIYALTSFNEGMNLTLLEAMSTGLPVVATAVGGNAEIVEEGITGYLVNSGDIESLAERLRNLVNSPELRATMGMKARERVLSHFDQRSMMQKYLSLYRGAGTGLA